MAFIAGRMLWRFSCHSYSQPVVTIDGLSFCLRIAPTDYAPADCQWPFRGRSQFGDPSVPAP